MSNTRRVKAAKPRPPEDIRSLAAAYECGHCTADKTLWHDGTVWRLKVAHSLTCPVHLGHVDRAPQLADAVRARRHRASPGRGCWSCQRGCPA